MWEGDGKTLVGEAGRLLALSGSVSFYLIGEPGTEQYSLAFSILLQPDFFFFNNVVLVSPTF